LRFVPLAWGIKVVLAGTMLWRCCESMVVRGSEICFRIRIRPLVLCSEALLRRVALGCAGQE